MTAITSIIAAAKIKPKAATLRGEVFKFILARGSHGATLDEAQVELRLDGNTVRPRRKELEERGLVVDSGFRRPSARGNPSVVWIVPTHIAPLAMAKLMSIAKELECSIS